MNRIIRVSAFVLLVALSSFAQSSTTGAVIDVDEATKVLQIETDKEATRLTVETDTLSTQYNGFGGVIAGKPEIFIGSKGFSNVRIGDRIEVRGTTKSRGVLMASDITLLGRSISASPTGVGDTRSPSSASTQTDRSTTVQRGTSSTTEGTVRQVNVDEGRIVIQTPQRRLITINAYRNTPVYYRNEQYRISNLEIGDRIRVEVDPRDAQGDEITAVRIDVISGVQDSTTTVPPSGGTVTIIQGRVARVDSNQNYAWITTRDDEVRIDMARAQDGNGKPIDATDLRVGDSVEVMGSFNRIGDIFLASTIRMSATGGRNQEALGFAIVTINGTVTETLDDATTLGVRDRDANRVVRLWVTDDFVVKLKASTSTADKLRKDDNLRIKAFRDDAGNLVAQTITVRNR